MHCDPSAAERFLSAVEFTFDGSCFSAALRVALDWMLPQRRAAEKQESGYWRAFATNR
jgi:hypothetical protein